MCLVFLIVATEDKNIVQGNKVVEHRVHDCRECRGGVGESEWQDFEYLYCVCVYDDMRFVVYTRVP